MSGHIIQQDQYAAPRCRLAMGVARNWSAALKIMTDGRHLFEKKVTEEFASAVVSALMIGILVGATLRAANQTRGPDRTRRPA